jgi:hypothetical protein
MGCGASKSTIVANGASLSAATAPTIAPTGTMKLHYFGLYGRAESSRMMLTKAGIQFEDCRLTGAEWGPIKAEMIKSSGFGGMPFLEFPDGTRMY